MQSRLIISFYVCHIKITNCHFLTSYHWSIDFKHTNSFEVQVDVLVEITAGKRPILIYVMYSSGLLQNIDYDEDTDQWYDIRKWQLALGLLRGIIAVPHTQTNILSLQTARNITAIISDQSMFAKLGKFKKIRNWRKALAWQNWYELIEEATLGLHKDTLCNVRDGTYYSAQTHFKFLAFRTKYIGYLVW